MSPYAAHHAPIDRAPNVHGNEEACCCAADEEEAMSGTVRWHCPCGGENVPGTHQCRTCGGGR